MADYAIEEITHWLQDGRLTGLKLHLANSGLDLRNQDHISKLCAIFVLMNDFERPIVIHLAHIAGWGGYDAATDRAIQAFLDACDEGTLDRSRIWFDIAAVVDAKMHDEDAARLTARLRDIGLDRVLFATDWNEVDPRSHIDTLRNTLTLSDIEWAQLMSNEVPYLHQLPE